MNFITRTIHILGAALFPALAFACVWSASPALAADMVGTSITPPIFEITASPGDVVKRSLEVHNTSNVSLTYTMVLDSFLPSGDEGAQAFFPAQSGDLSGWTTVKPSVITLGPDAAARVEFIISVPKNASPGGHYATIFASTEGERGGVSGIATGHMVGANILVNVTGEVVQSASVLEFSTPRSRLFPGEPIDFTVRVKNTGNVHIKPQGVIEIYRGDVKVDEVVVNPGGGNVLPNSTRKFTAESNKALASGTYRAELSLKYDGQTISVPSISFIVLGETSLATLVAGLLGVFVVILLIALFIKRKPSLMAGGKGGRM